MRCSIADDVVAFEHDSLQHVDEVIVCHWDVTPPSIMLHRVCPDHNDVERKRFRRSTDDLRCRRRLELRFEIVDMILDANDGIKESLEKREAWKEADEMCFLGGKKRPARLASRF